MLPSKRELNALELMISLSTFSKLLLTPRKNIEVAQQQQKYYADLKRRLDEICVVNVKVLPCTKKYSYEKEALKSSFQGILDH
jgi:hypothetical protein